jgi:hypothetical protein
MPDGYLGRNFLLKIETATPGTYVTVGGMRTTSCKKNNGAIDVTTKDDGVWRRQIAGGIQSLDISGSGVVRNDASQKRLSVLANSGDAVLCKVTFADGDEFAGSFIISDFERSGDHDKEETYSVSLQSAGVITFTEGA